MQFFHGLVADRKYDGKNFTICDLFWDFFRAMWNAPKKQYEKTLKPKFLKYKYFLYWLLLIAILLTGDWVAQSIGMAILFLVWVFIFFALGILYILPIVFFEMYLDDREYEKPKLFTALIRFIAWVALCFYITIPIVVLFPHAPAKGYLEIVLAILIPCTVIGLIGGIIQIKNLFLVISQLIFAISKNIKDQKERNTISPFGFVYNVMVSLKKKLCFKIEFVD